MAGSLSIPVMGSMGSMGGNSAPLMAVKRSGGDPSKNTNKQVALLMLGVLVLCGGSMLLTGKRRSPPSSSSSTDSKLSEPLVLNDNSIGARTMGQGRTALSGGSSGTPDVVVSGVDPSYISPPKRPYFGRSGARAQYRRPDFSMGNRMGAIKSSALSKMNAGSLQDSQRMMNLDNIYGDRAQTTSAPHVEDDEEDGDLPKPSAEKCAELRTAVNAMNKTVADPVETKISVGEAGSVTVGAGIRPYDDLFQHTMEMVVCGVPFAHVSFTRDEANLINGKPFATPELLATKGHMLPSHDVAYQQLREDLLHILAHTDPSFKFGVPIPPCREGLKEVDPRGGGDVASLVTFLGHIGIVGNSDHAVLPRLSYADLFSHRNYQKAASFFKELLASRSDVRLYALGNFVRDHPTPWLERTVQLPPDLIEHWPIWRERILDDARQMAKQMGDQPTIFLFDAGPVGKVILNHMYNAYPQHTYIDINGVLDEAHGGRKRNPEKFYTGDRARRMDDGALDGTCTYTRYVRVGDCVTTPLPSDGVIGKERLEPLVKECFSKGAKGKPLAARVGGFFHDNVAKMLRKSAEGAEKQKKMWNFWKAPDPKPLAANTLTMQGSVSKALPEGWGHD